LSIDSNTGVVLQQAMNTISSNNEILFTSHAARRLSFDVNSDVSSFFVSLHWLWQRAMSPADIANPAANVRPFLDRFDLYTVSFNDYSVSSSSSSSSILRVPRRLA